MPVVERSTEVGHQPGMIPPAARFQMYAGVREVICNAVAAGRQPTKAEAATVIHDLRGHTPDALKRASDRIAVAIANGVDVLKEPHLQALLTGGAAAALYSIALERKQLRDRFEKGAFYRTEQKLRAAYIEANRELEAARADENSTDAKIRRLRSESEAARQRVNSHVNAGDPDYRAFKTAMKQTSHRGANALDWRNFAI